MLNWYRMIAVAGIAFALATGGAPAAGPSPANPSQTCEWRIGEVWRGDDQLSGAFTCSVDDPQAALSLGCWGDEIVVTYAHLMDPSLFEEDGLYFEFTTEKASRLIVMRMNEMDSTDEVMLKPTDRLFELLSSSQMLTLSDEEGVYPKRQFSLQGSRAAIDKLLATCAAEAVI